MIEVISAIVIAYITAKVTMRNEKTQSIYRERKAIYFDLLEYMDKVKKDVSIIVSDKLHDETVILKNKIMLYASEDVIELFMPAYEHLMSAYNNYQCEYELREENNALSLEFVEGEDIKYKVDQGSVNAAFGKIYTQIRKEIQTTPRTWHHSHMYAFLSNVLMYIWNLVERMFDFINRKLFSNSKKEG